MSKHICPTYFEGVFDALRTMEAKLDIAIQKPQIEGSVIVCKHTFACHRRMLVPYHKTPGSPDILPLCCSCVPCSDMKVSELRII